MRSPKDFFRPLAVGAPAPAREVPFRPSRMIHFFDPVEPEDGRQGARARADRSTSCSATSRTRVPADRQGGGPRRAWWRSAQRDRLRRHPALDPGQQPRLALGARRPDHPGHRDRRQARRRSWCPKVEGAEDIHYVDRLLAQLEAKAGLSRPILVHAILETARGVANVEEIAARQPAHAGHLARPRRPRRQPPDEDHPGRRRAPRLPGPRRTPLRRRHRRRPRHLPAGPVALHDRPHGRRLRGATASCRTTARSATSQDVVACEDQFRNAFLLGCVGAWTPAPGADRHRQAGVLARAGRRAPGPAGSSTRWATAPAR